MRITKKVWKLGGSLGTIFPSVWTKENDIKQKDLISIDVKKEKLIITKKEDNKK